MKMSIPKKNLTPYEKSVEASKALETARSDVKYLELNKKSVQGKDSYGTYLSLQRSKRNSDSAAVELRKSFRLIEGDLQ